MGTVIGGAFVRLWSKATRLRQRLQRRPKQGQTILSSHPGSRPQWKRAGHQPPEPLRRRGSLTSLPIPIEVKLLASLLGMPSMAVKHKIENASEEPRA